MLLTGGFRPCDGDEVDLLRLGAENGDGTQGLWLWRS